VTSIFAGIESAETDAAISSESSLRRVLTKLNSVPEVQRVLNGLLEATISPEMILSRMMRLASKTVDYRFRNPHDTALAAYLYSIVVCAPNSLLVACRIALGAPHTWLSAQIVEIILNDWGTKYSSVQQEFSHSVGLPSWVKGQPQPQSPSTEVFNDFIQIGPPSMNNRVYSITSSAPSESEPVSLNKYLFKTAEEAIQAFSSSPMVFGSVPSTVNSLPIPSTVNSPHIWRGPKPA